MLPFALRLPLLLLCLLAMVRHARSQSSGSITYDSASSMAYGAEAPILRELGSPLVVDESLVGDSRSAMSYLDQCAAAPALTASAAPKPCLEKGPGSSTFWHDPFGNGYRYQEPLCHNSRHAKLFVFIESVSLYRDETGSTNVLPTISNGPLSSSEFETEFEHSARGTLGLALGDWYRLEYSWLNEMEWTDRLAATDNGQTETTDFASSFKTGEINVRRRVRIDDWPRHYPDYWNSFELSTLVGYRYVDLSERLAFGSGVNRSSNDLSGFQVGLLSQWLYEDRGWWDCEVKGAILANDIEVVSHLPAFDDDESRTAFLIDASIVCNYQFSQSLTLRLGYNFYWLSGVALVSENTFAGNASPASGRHDGELLLHGPSIGLVFAH